MRDRKSKRIEREREILARQARERERVASTDPASALLANGRENHYYDAERERYNGGILGIQLANRDAGHHWFDAESLRFFGSRISESTFDGRYFISSELNFDGSARLYTIREAMSDGSIGDAGEGFQGYSTRAQAIAAMERIKREGEG